MFWKLLLVLGTAALAAYRVRVLRQQKIPTASALGFAFDRRALIDLGIGAAITLVSMSMVFAAEYSAGLISVTRVGPPSALANDILTSIAVPLIEEFVFRCAVLGALLLLTRNTAVAVAISALIFGVGHALNANAGFVSIISTALGGLAYSIAFAASERIWLPFGLHFGWNYAEGRLFGFHLSGGAIHPAPFVQQHDIGPTILTGGEYGPEAGLVGLLARLVVLALITAWVMSAKRRADRTPMVRSATSGE
jgi:membrane protease YdiL (CAAX protease family)